MVLTLEVEGSWVENALAPTSWVKCQSATYNVSNAQREGSSALPSLPQNALPSG